MEVISEGINKSKVVIVYDVENLLNAALLNYAIGKAQKLNNGILNAILLTDLKKIPPKRIWNRIIKRKGINCMSVERGDEKNALDTALRRSALEFSNQDIVGFIVISRDKDFAKLTIELMEKGNKTWVIGDNETSQKLKNSCEKFLVYPYL